MEEATGFRVSPQQEDLWANEPDGPTGSIQAVLSIEEPLEPSVLEAALERVIGRHEILRTTFARRPGIRVPFQVIHDSLAASWEILDLDGAGEDDRRARIDAALTEARSQPWDYEHGPVVRATLADPGDGHQILALTLPALSADAASVPALISDLIAYSSDGELADEPLQYADFSEWQHERRSAGDEAAQAAKARWQEALDGAAPRVPLARVPVLPPALDEVVVPVDAALTESLAKVATRYGTTSAAVIHAAWHAFLARVTAQDDVIVATLNATPRHPDLEGAIGLVARPLPIRTKVPAELTFAELVDQLDGELASAGAQADWAPATSRTVGPGILARPTFELGDHGVRAVVARFTDSSLGPLTLAYELPPGASIRLGLVFDQTTITREHAEMLAAQFERLLRSAVATPDAAVGELELLGGDDLELLIDSVNETTSEGSSARAHELFALRAVETPDALAVTDGVGSVTYAVLDARANQLAHRLHAGGVGAGDVVALCTDRSVEMAVGVLGILKAGGAYLPLNQEHPVARLAHQATESGARALVTQEALLGRLPDFADVVCLDRDRTELDALDANAPDPVGGPDDLVYVIYTSGSTGAPKGVSVTHRNLSNYIGDIVGRLGAEGKAWVFGMVTAISTDLGNTAFFPALASGGTLALVRPETAVDPAAFAHRFEDSPLDVLKITPSHLHALLAANDGRLLPREWLVLGGERLGWDLVDRVRSLATCRILNHYGPTETTIGSCTMLVGDGRGVYHSATVPIGGPIANTRAYVLDDTLLPVPLDVPGRLFIGGAGVARGYIGQADLTTERFLPDSFAAVADARMYDTGDLARRLPDGTLEFLGRVDEQVKIRGFRVEPSEIEAALRNHPAVENAAVIAVEDTPGDIRLVAYCAVTANASADDLRGHLSEWVPEFMVPSAFVMLDTLPLTPSGKVDRLALPDLAQPASGVEEEYVAPRTAVEEAVAAIWADVLGVERVSVEADFFALGGHSLLATQVVAQVRTDFAIELPLHSLFMCPTVALLSEEIVGLLGAAEQDETASLLAELEGLSDEEASRLVQELAQGDEAG